jgi:hypothetical protein
MCYTGTCDGYAYPKQIGLLYSKMVIHFTFFNVYSYYVLFFTSSAMIVVGAR